MTHESFFNWLAGFFDLAQPSKGLDPQQTQIIKDHIDLVRGTKKIKARQDYCEKPKEPPNFPFHEKGYDKLCNYPKDDSQVFIC